MVLERVGGPMISRLAVPPDAVRTPSSLMRAHDHATSPARVRGWATLNSAASPAARVTGFEAWRSFPSATSSATVPPRVPMFRTTADHLTSSPTSQGPSSGTGCPPATTSKTAVEISRASTTTAWLASSIRGPTAAQDSVPSFAGPSACTSTVSAMLTLTDRLSCSEPSDHVQLMAPTHGACPVLERERLCRQASPGASGVFWRSAVRVSNGSGGGATVVFHCIPSSLESTSVRFTSTVLRSIPPSLQKMDVSTTTSLVFMGLRLTDVLTISCTDP